MLLPLPAPTSGLVRLPLPALTSGLMLLPLKVPTPAQMLLPLKVPTPTLVLLPPKVPTLVPRRTPIKMAMLRIIDSIQSPTLTKSRISGKGVKWFC
ncbi:CIH_collapsed_G0039640.mRNA.1.CDS.1 [Saccharomyces cerevisiae]|nr:CIH_HP1_G0038830.mRNA.1.CDS.1 [Saccharomyces cerevisiae]CAI7438424.1 CIH_collapsed_G0039640.mRNA.1.CDS.1 [Saccharomyces cerevisiae]